MRALASFVSGRRGKWVVLGIWIVVFAALMPLGAKLGDETQDDTTSFLPASAESTEVVKILDEDFPSGETTQGLIVYQRDGGLTAADKQKIAADAKALEELPRLRAAADAAAHRPVRPQLAAGPGLPAGGPRLHRADGADQLRGAGRLGRERPRPDRLRERRDADHPHRRPRLLGRLRGGLPELDTKLLLATVLLVLFLLGAIYRAVLVALTPLLVVFFAYTAATALVYLYAESGATVSTNGTTILIVLMFGVGTDYCLLLVSRYREELRRIEDKHDAMARALRRTGPTILASGLTVSLAMPTLALADARLTSTLGPVAAIGVACGMVAGLTLLPALLTIFGRRGFWPRASVVAATPRTRRRPARGSGAGSATASCSGRRPRWRSLRSCSSPERSACSPTRSTTRPPRSSRSRSSRSRASSCSRRRSRLACCT